MSINNKIWRESKARILASLESSRWLTLSEIAEKSSTSRPKAILVLKWLAERGLIEARTVRDKHDATKARWEYRARSKEESLEKS